MKRLYNILNYDEPEIKWYAKPSMPLAKVLTIEEHAGSIYLYRYSKNGAPAGDTLHESLKDAKNQAEFEYEDALSEWKVIPDNESDPMKFVLKDSYTYINYPRQGFLVILFVLHEGKLASIHPLFEFFQSIDEAAKYVKLMIEVVL